MLRRVLAGVVPPLLSRVPVGDVAHAGDVARAGVADPPVRPGVSAPWGEPAGRPAPPMGLTASGDSARAVSLGAISLVNG